MPFSLLRERLLKRLEKMGIKVGQMYEEVSPLQDPKKNSSIYLHVEGVKLGQPPGQRVSALYL